MALLVGASCRHRGDAFEEGQRCIAERNECVVDCRGRAADDAAAQCLSGCNSTIDRCFEALSEEPPTELPDALAPTSATPAPKR